MTREEAQQRFWQSYAQTMCKQALEQVDQYYRQHRDNLAEEFVAAFTNFFRQVRQKQDKGQKGKVSYFCCSMLYTALLRDQPAWRMDAYDKNAYNDEQECSISFDTPWLFDPLQECCRKLDQERRKYAGKINPCYIDSIKRQQAFRYIPYAILCARQALKQAVNSEEFSALHKEERVNFWVGEYKDLSETVYCYDVTVKDSAKIKRWLEKRIEDEYFGSILTDLDLSNGDYEGTTLSYARLTGSILKQVNISDALLYGSEFSKCIIQDGDFSYSQINGAIFDNAIIQGTTFQESDGSQTDLYHGEGTEEMLIDILAGASFRQSEITQTDFSYSELKEADFTDAKLEQVSFAYAYLAEVNFQNAVLVGCDFSGADLSSAKMQNAVFTDCKFNEADLQNTCFSSGSLKEICLDELQKQQISLVGG